jgi:hypothetical protein
MKPAIVHQVEARRLIALAFACSLISGCSGVGSGFGNGSSPLLPQTAAQVAPSVDSGTIPALLRFRIPRGAAAAATHRGARIERPSTISALTASVGVSIDGGKAQVFNTTPSSPGCVIGATGLVCTFQVRAAVGTDTFSVTTYSKTKAGGTILDRGVATIAIARGKANKVVATLGPVVSKTSDSGVGSLRYAIATANSGDTIMFVLPNKSTIVLSSPITVASTVTLAGPGIASGVAISGNNTTQLFINTGLLTISGLTLTKGNAASPGSPGGVIYNIGTITFNADLVGSSTSQVSLRHSPLRQSRLHTHGLHPRCTTTGAQGGAVYNAGIMISDGTTYAANVVFSDTVTCVQGEGAAIYSAPQATLSSSNDTFKQNSAYQGAGIDYEGTAPLIVTKDAFIDNTGCTATSGCPTTGCTGTGCTTNAEGIGIGIFAEGPIIVTSSTFTGNIAGGSSNGSNGDGAAIAAAATSLVTASTFTSNLAGGGTADCSNAGGGAIFAAGPLEVDDDTFTGNKAQGDSTGVGGAIAATTSVTGTNDTFTSNVASGYGSACAASADGLGGAVYGTAATLQNSTFTKNSASGNVIGGGGGIAGANVSATNDTFTSNTGIGTGTQSAASSAAGGALYASTSLAVHASTFTGNRLSIEGSTANEAFGGALFSQGETTSSNNNYKSNVVSAPNKGEAAGGAIGMNSGTLNSFDDTFASNLTTSGTAGLSGGGAIYLMAPSSIGHDTFTANAASSGKISIGGAVAIMGASTLSDDVFTGNKAKVTHIGGEGAGGAVVDAGSVTLLNSVVSDNTAQTGGGALATGVNDVIFASTITGNTVLLSNITESGGGAIDADDAIDIVDSTISNNTVTVKNVAQTGGGGIYQNGGSLSLSLSTVTGNKVLGTAPSSGGGGIFLNEGATISNSTIGGNTSADAGGGLYVGVNNTVTATNTTFYKNTAKTNGGNLENLFTISVQNSIFAGGSAGTGADIDNQGTLTSLDYNIVQSNVSGTPMSGTTMHNLMLTNPKLLALSNNGGPTFTYADQATSPGRKHIPYASGCGGTMVTTDQRSYARGAGGKCDVGAYEYAGVATALQHGTEAPAIPAAILAGRREGGHHDTRWWREFRRPFAAALRPSAVFARLRAL